MKEIYLKMEQLIKKADLQNLMQLFIANEKLDLNAFGGRTLLYYAVKIGSIDICDFLIKNGAKVNHSNDNFYSPLESASSCNNIIMLEYLINNEADINSYETTCISAINTACTFGNLKAVEYLVEKSGDINRLHLTGYLTPLDLAITKQQPEIVEYLEKEGAVVSVYDKHDWTKEKGGGISEHIHHNYGRVIPLKFNLIDDVFTRIATVNKETNIMLFTTGNYLGSKLMSEFLMILPWGWNPYSKKETSVYPFLLLNKISEQLKKGNNYKDGDVILTDTLGFEDLPWLDDLAGVTVVDYDYLKTDSNANFDKKEDVYLFTLIPIKKTKKGYTKQSLDKLKGYKWKKLEFKVETLRPILGQK